MNSRILCSIAAVVLVPVVQLAEAAQKTTKVASIEPRADPKPFRISLSVSPFTELLFSKGIVFSDGKSTAQNPEQLQQLFIRHGANEVYARIATTRSYHIGFGDHSLDKGLERARMARTLNLPLNPELGLFHVYGDVGCQPPPDFRDYPELQLPGVWTSLTLDQMLPALHSYGAIVAKAILKTGVRVRIWDLGNEVDFGSAGIAPRPLTAGCDDTAGGPGWYQPPDRVDPAIGKMSVRELVKLPEPQRIAWLQTHVWPHLARMLAATASGIRSVDPGARFSTHLSGISATIPAQAMAFYKAMKEGGFLPDELGFSFYASSPGTPPERLQNFYKTLIDVHTEFSRPVFIAEFGYPAETVKEGEFSTWNNALGKYPLTPQGQADLIRDIVAWGPAASVSGFRPWAPEVAVAGWAPFALLTLDGKTARARPSLDAILQGLHLSNR